MPTETNRGKQNLYIGYIGYIWYNSAWVQYRVYTQYMQSVVGYYCGIEFIAVTVDGAK